MIFRAFVLIIRLNDCEIFRIRQKCWRLKATRTVQRLHFQVEFSSKQVHVYIQCFSTKTHLSGSSMPAKCAEWIYFLIKYLQSSFQFALIVLAPCYVFFHCSGTVWNRMSTGKCHLITSGIWYVTDLIWDTNVVLLSGCPLKFEVLFLQRTVAVHAGLKQQEITRATSLPHH